MQKFQGAFTALATPFRQGRVDDAALTRLVEQQIEGGIDGLVPCGTTGESATLSYAEHLHVVEVVIKANAGRVPVLAGAGANSTHEAIELARACKELGADGTLQVTPYYNKPTQQGLIKHFTTIADAVGLPMVLYNVPSRTACDLQPETVGVLSKHPMIVGVKEATGDMGRVSLLRELCGEDFTLLSGDDFSVLGFLACGGHGVISVITNVLPGVLAKMCAAARAGDFTQARKLHELHLPLTRALFSTTSPIPVKKTLAMIGIMENELRLPLVPMEDDDPKAQLLVDAVAALRAADVLPAGASAR